MSLTDITPLQAITAPFAASGAHVQGPGGNTSFKSGDNLLIKASGYTFHDVKNGIGVVSLDNHKILDQLSERAKNGAQVVENAPPQITGSWPQGLRPSMEFEFHALLKKYVLHTHSVYINVLTCAATCADLLSSLFPANEYCLVPYCTPGFPIAAWLFNHVGQENIAPVIFLKNHGIIVHGDTAEEVLSLYRSVEEKIRGHFALDTFSDIAGETNGDELSLPAALLGPLANDLSAAGSILMEEVLIPDQSIFFKDKVVPERAAGSCIVVGEAKNTILICGPEKFRNAGRSMLQAVYYIRAGLTRLGLTPDFIPAAKIAEMHNLATEKYRINTLKQSN